MTPLKIQKCWSSIVWIVEETLNSTRLLHDQQDILYGTTENRGWLELYSTMCFWSAFGFYVENFVVMLEPLAKNWEKLKAVYNLRLSTVNLSFSVIINPPIITNCLWLIIIDPFCRAIGLLQLMARLIQ